MTNPANFNDGERLLDRMARSGSASVPEPLRITSPGARQSIWSANVLSNISYNLYSVALVKLNQAGQTPTELDTQMQAYNLAESFTSQGELSAGTYITISRIGDKKSLLRTGVIMTQTNGKTWSFNRQINLSVVIQLLLLAFLIIGSYVNLQGRLDLLQHDVTMLLQCQKQFQQKLESLTETSISYEYRLQALEVASMNCSKEVER